MTTAESLLFAYDRSSMMLHLFVDDLTPADFLKRAVPGANPVAWAVGHLITVERNALKFLNLPMPALPTEDFTTRFAKGSTPSDNAADYGDVTKLMPIFDEQRRLIVEAIKTLPADVFARPIEHPVFKSVGQFLTLIPNHCMLHAGQISTIRRSLGKPAAI